MLKRVQHDGISTVHIPESEEKVIINNVEYQPERPELVEGLKADLDSCNEESPNFQQGNDLEIANL